MKVILIPGNGGGRPGDYWYPYLKKGLEKIGIPVIASEFPDSDLARARYWLPFIKNKLRADEESVLVGHSSGAIAALRYAEEHTILGSVLVGVYYSDLGDEKERKSGYFSHPWNWKAIKRNQQWIIEYASINDPWIPIEEPRLIRDKLDTEYYEYTDRGHFNRRNTFPELLNALKRRLAS